MSENKGQWLDVAQFWNQVGTPLRPSIEDVTFMTKIVHEWSRNNGSIRALILGVTPELHDLDWPVGTKLMAVDRTQAMIDYVWPGSSHAVICSNWLDMPLQNASYDIVLCDGGFHLLSHPVDQQRLINKLQRVIAPNGLCLFRLFVPPTTAETPNDVWQDLIALKIPNLNVLKLRLGMALQQDVTDGVELAKVWDKLWEWSAADFNQLANYLNWPIEHLLIINTYRNNKARYHFLCTEGVCEAFCNQGFKWEYIYTPTYTLGERCPTVVLNRLP